MLTTKFVNLYHFMRTKGLSLAAVTFFASMAFVSQGMAAGSGSYSTDKAECKKGETYSNQYGKCIEKCKSGYVYSSGQNKCVIKSSRALSDSARIAQAELFGYSGQYNDAIDVLSSVQKRDTPEYWNLLGFSTRKSGDVARGIGFYQKALDLDPDYVLAREYLGEGYLQLGDIDAASLQLKEIADRCGVECNEYKDLRAEIDAYQVH